MIDKLHYISQQPESGSHLSAIRQALEAGCKWVQLRVKNQSDDLILEYALELGIDRYSLSYIAASTNASNCFSDIPTIFSATCYAHTKPPSSLSLYMVAPRGTKNLPSNYR